METNNTLRLALLQCDLHWESPKLNLDSIATQLELLRNDVDLLVLPEMFTTGFTMTETMSSLSFNKITIDWMQRIATDHNVVVVGSIPFAVENNRVNRLLVVNTDGVVTHYDKRHTFTLAGENKVYTSGDKLTSFMLNGFKICPLICYDLRFPVWARNSMDYDVLLYVANWPKPRIAAWDTLLKARAIENMAYCVGVNRVGVDPKGNEYPGHTAVYNVLGETVAFSENNTEIVYATLQKKDLIETREKLPFLADKDNFTLVK